MFRESVLRQEALQSIGYRLFVAHLLCIFSAAAPVRASESLRPVFDKLIQAKMTEAGIVGLSISVIDGDQVIYERGFGYADRARHRPATPDTVYRMGSVSKVLTGMAVMQLKESGAVDLDAPIDRYLPKWRMKPRFDEDSIITPRHLLTHHAGLPTDLMQGADTRRPEGLSMLLRRLEAVYPAQAAGKVFQYSNLGYAVLGKLIESISGEDFPTYMDRHLFTPLGMTRSGFEMTEGIESDLSKGYIRGDEQPQYPVREKPAAGLYSSVRDIRRLLRMVVSGDARILSRESIEEMLVRQNAHLPLDLDLSVGLAWQLTHRLAEERNAGPMAWHDGWLWHFSSSVALLPKHRFGVVVAANTDGARKAVSAIAKAVLRRLLWQRHGVKRAPFAPPVAAAPLDPKAAGQLLGRYDTSAGLVDIEMAGDRLVWRSGRRRLCLVPLRDGTFAMEKFLNDFLTYRPSELEEKRLRFVEVDGQLLVATMDNGQRIPLGRKISPPDIPPIWKRLLGTYALTRESEDFVAVRRIELKIDAGYLVAEIRISGDYTRTMRQTVALIPVSDRVAFVAGVGRYRGDVLSIGAGRRPVLRFQGYELKKR